MKIIIGFLFCFFSITSIAQSNDTIAKNEKISNKWLFKVGANFVHNFTDKSPFDSYDIEKKCFSNPFSAGVDYRFTKNMSLGLMLSNNQFLKESDQTNGFGNLSYFSTDLNLKLFLWDLKKENRKNFNMYVLGGVSSFKLQTDDIAYNTGVGVMIWFNDVFGFNLQSVYKWSSSNKAVFHSNHYQHFAGFIFKPKSKNDRDGDGVADIKDGCPDTFGLAALKGCPDTDGDGIIDTEDNCPNNAGKRLDKGCPDTDKDGVFDGDDSCIDTAGPKENFGCPYIDTDNDGILDKDDRCPDVKGNPENHCCDKEQPKTEQASTDALADPIKILGKALVAIYFEPSGIDIREDMYTMLYNIVLKLKDFPATQIILEGHADSIDSDEVNQKVSFLRVQAVQDFFIENGIAPENIEIKTFGESKPVATNMSKDGRALNRRVLIKIKQ